jgi:hypothetical protein
MQLQRSFRFLAATALLAASFNSPASADAHCREKALLHMQVVNDLPVCDISGFCAPFHEDRDFVLGAGGCASVIKRQKVMAGSIVGLEPGNFIEGATRQHSAAALKAVRDGLIAIKAGVRQSCRLDDGWPEMTFTWYGRDLRENTFAAGESVAAEPCDAAMISFLRAVLALEQATLTR